MRTAIPTDIELARCGLVTHRNYSRLGYTRLIRGVYGRPPEGNAPRSDDLDRWERQRADFLARTHATMAAYADKGAVLFGATALQVLGVALPETLEDWDRCHIMVPPGCPRPTRTGVVFHLSPQPLTVWRKVDGLPVLHPVDHWIQLRGATADELVEVGDGLMRRRNPLLTPAGLTARLEACAGRPGSKKVRSVLKLLAPGTDSLYETRTRLALVHAGLPQPAVNHKVFSHEAGFHYPVDMAYIPEKIGVEYDGKDHVNDREQMEWDANRRRHLQDEGWFIITVTASHLRNPLWTRSAEAALILRRAALTPDS